MGDLRVSQPSSLPSWPAKIIGVRRALCERATGLRVISSDVSKAAGKGVRVVLAGRDAAEAAISADA